MRTRDASTSSVEALTRRTLAPYASIISSNIVTSWISGIFSIRHTPSTSNAAGKIAAAAFLAPLILISPNSGFAPFITYLTNECTFLFRLSVKKYQNSVSFSEIFPIHFCVACLKKRAKFNLYENYCQQSCRISLFDNWYYIISIGENQKK